MSKSRQIKRHKATAIPIADPTELAMLPTGSVISDGKHSWRKNDENALITRKEARRQQKAVMDAFMSDTIDYFERQRKDHVTADKAIYREEAERRCIFSAVLFVGDPSWEAGMEVLRRRYHEVASKALDEVRKLRKLWTDDSEMIAAFVHFENLLMALSSEMSEALRQALAEGDKGVALKNLSEHMATMSITDELNELLGGMRTEGIATERSWDRGSVWIGWQCNRMERTKQTDSIEAMWKALQRRMSVNRDRLWGDELQAWQWLGRHKQTDADRQISKEVSRFKQQMKPYYERWAPLDKTQDN